MSQCAESSCVVSHCDVCLNVPSLAVLCLTRRGQYFTRADGAAVGADVHAKTAAGFTPSYFATIKKRPAIAKVLREQPKWFLGSEQTDDK